MYKSFIGLVPVRRRQPAAIGTVAPRHRPALGRQRPRPDLFHPGNAPDGLQPRQRANQPGNWAFDALLKFDNLRYRLMPYIY